MLLTYTTLCQTGILRNKYACKLGSGNSGQQEASLIQCTQSARVVALAMASCLM